MFKSLCVSAGFHCSSSRYTEPCPDLHHRSPASDPRIPWTGPWLWPADHGERKKNLSQLGISVQRCKVTFVSGKTCTCVCVRVCVVQALEDRVTEITPSALSFVDSETPSEKLIYNITKALPPGQGRTHTHTHMHTCWAFPYSFKKRSIKFFSCFLLITLRCCELHDVIRGLLWWSCSVIQS